MSLIIKKTCKTNKVHRTDKYKNVEGIIFCDKYFVEFFYKISIESFIMLEISLPTQKDQHHLLKEKKNLFIHYAKNFLQAWIEET